jgi:hypothetical protein
MIHTSIVLDYQSISPTNTFAKTHRTALSQFNSIYTTHKKWVACRRGLRYETYVAMVEWMGKK